MQQKIDFVKLSNLQRFVGNPIEEQHKLRYEQIIGRQSWDVPSYEGMEFDQYDNPAAKYVICRDQTGNVLGSSRLYPTTLPYMLEKQFSNFVTAINIPKSNKVWEGSRFCVNHKLPPLERKKIISHLVVAYLEAGIDAGIDAIVGIMYPAYWRGIFTKSGWDVEFIGDTMTLDDGHKARAALLPVNEDVLLKVRETTRIFHTVLNYGDLNEGELRKTA